MCYEYGNSKASLPWKVYKESYGAVVVSVWSFAVSNLGFICKGAQATPELSLLL